jgi:hypothetical protein
MSTPKMKEITMSAYLCRDCEKAIQECERRGEFESLPLTSNPFPFKETKMMASNPKEVQFAWDEAEEVKPGSYPDWFMTHFGKEKGREFCLYGEVIAELMERSDCIDCCWVNEDDYNEKFGLNDREE